MHVKQLLKSLHSNKLRLKQKALQFKSEQKQSLHSNKLRLKLNRQRHKHIPHKGLHSNKLRLKLTALQKINEKSTFTFQ